ncbi:bifunctional 2',3'-cyclic-nucleotide 2'-phosphodiesterase/3'-nucleotidase [Brevibacillus daliensis]|uniref:bifunctional 2',3'-cyclic-nucleotide 2'-phosphodiesterase/3'-nucleotidase n=1 Tax=Brevibacillus daliensis TaxID=2892995 RepID=UPI001E3170BB|nr:bifunctional 2',3'-cyclic-nucleotide 2'-phosphodiesterase/3'-nucleotidase [Brevibacillus daliensis]
MSKKKYVNSLLASSLALSVFVLPTAQASAAEGESIVKLRLMETTDIHVNVLNYDYYKDGPTDSFGLAKTATLVKNARTEVKNSMLFDNGDLIQGNPLGDYMNQKGLKTGEIHPVYKAMNLMDYDVGNIGNHEFNYGLDFLKASLSGAEFPYVNANVYVDDKDKNPDNDKLLFDAYKIIDKKVVDENGKEATVKVGVIGFVPPQIMTWDKANLEGKVIAKDIVESAKKYVPEMKAKGADVVIAVPHSGFEDLPAKGMDENSVAYLSKVADIDAIMFGHSHKLFPSKDFEGKEGVDLEKGTINGVPSVMPGYWGDHLGVIDLTLKQIDGKWDVVDTKTEARPIYDATAKKALVEADKAIVEAVKDEHAGAIDYIRGPIGETTADINSYFALVNDDPSVQVVSNAQKWWAEKAVQGTEYEGLPILSSAAPFKAGGRNGVEYYTDIKAGTMAVKSAFDLYLYPNTIKAVQVDGATVKDYLERAAGQFKQIDPNKKEEQELVDATFPTYNFDTLDGVTYEVDVTQPNKYDTKGNLVNKDANRIVNLQFEGKAIDPAQKFIIVTNNYRAFGGGNFPKMDGSTVIIDSPEENREVVINYLREQKTFNPSADNNWGFAPIKGDVNLTFVSSPKAKDYANKFDHIKYVGEAADGFAKYSIDLSKSTVAAPAQTEEAKAEEAKKEEPKKEEPKKEEPKTEEPKKEEPKTEEPKKEEPKTEEPKKEEPKTEEPKKEEPKTEEPKKEEPKKEEPKKEEPKADPNRLVAVRSVGDANGIKVTYEHSTRTVTLTKGTVTLVHVIGDEFVTVNGKKVDAKTDLVDDRLYLTAGLLEETFQVTIK